MARIGAAISAGDKAAVATWYSSGWNRWWLRRSITVTWTGASRSRFAAARPANPAPTITT
jgi:NADH dehydrogenase FAD-containing subunit